MSKIFVDKLEKTTFLKRTSIALLCALMITYCILYLSIRFGTYALFLGGAIVGAMWSDVWQAIFREKSPLKKLYSLSPIPYIALFVALIILAISIIITHPLN